MAQQELEILQGTIGAVVYQNYDNGYAVLRLGVGGGAMVTVVGTIPLPAVGERLMVTGKWSSHPSYGRQFEAEFLERLLPQTSTDILSYLSSRIIKGIGPKTAARIVSHFGDETLIIMEQQPERLAEIFSSAVNHKLEPKRLCLLRHKENGPVSLVLVQCRKGAKPGLLWEEAVLFDQAGQPTEYYKGIYHL